MNNILDIDGNYLEGGGQILRIALSLSCILRKPVRIRNIRANRPNPGLSNQHLYGLNLLQQICNASVKGNYIKSTEVLFVPGNISQGNYTVDTKTAASISLVFQAALPVLLYAGSTSELEVIGGTNVGMAPQVDFLTEVLRDNLELFGVSFDFDLYKRGYYPRGGGHCKFTILPIERIRAAEIVDFGTVHEICGWCYVAGNLPLHLAEQMKQVLQKEVLALTGIEPQIEAYKESKEVARDNGAGLIVKAVTTQQCTIGTDALGDKRVDAHAMALKAAKQLEHLILDGICVDSHVQDQLLMFMALAEGVSRIRTCALTDHAKTAMHVLELMTRVKFNVKDLGNDNFLIECKGIGLRNKNIK